MAASFAPGPLISSAAFSASLDSGCISLVPLDFNFWLIFVSYYVFVWPPCFLQSLKAGCALTLHEALGGVQDRGESSSLEGGRQCQETTRNPTRGGEGVSAGTVHWIWRRFDAPRDTEWSRLA